MLDVDYAFTQLMQLLLIVANLFYNQHSGNSTLLTDPVLSLNFFNTCMHKYLPIQTFRSSLRSN